MKDKKNILLLSSIVPSPENKRSTPIVTYFASEWVRMGYNVIIIHNKATYPIFYYWVAKLFKKYIINLTGGAIVDTNRINKSVEYKIENVTIFQIPVYKKMPHGKYSSKTINIQEEKIKEFLKQKSFIPDYIIGHFSNPQLLLVNQLKRHYNSTGCMVMHDPGYNLKTVFKNNYRDLINDINVWGFRSVPIKQKFEEVYGKKNNSFQCYSGIPENFLKKDLQKDFSSDITNFLFVGELIKRKHPIVLLGAVKESMKDSPYEINYIGNGAQKKEIIKKSKKLSIQEYVKFYGHIAREEVITIMDNSHVFIMISQNEAFGLVYLEAMARGCITIASKGEGFDGIIQHGINGFLCNAGNEKELTELIKTIKNLGINKKIEISKSAIKTAENLTSYNAAKYYIEEVKKYKIESNENNSASKNH